MYSNTFCIHMEYSGGSMYDPPEAECKLDSEYNCDDCPYYYSKEDHMDDLADFEYECSKDLF